MLVLSDVAAALEHQVLEQVRKAGAAGTLVLRAHVVLELDVHDRRRVILVQDEPQPVGQPGRRVLDARRPLTGDERVELERQTRKPHDGRDGIASAEWRKAHCFDYGTGYSRRPEARAYSSRASRPSSAASRRSSVMSCWRSSGRRAKMTDALRH
jgi:hypothetical protein